MIIQAIILIITDSIAYQKSFYFDLFQSFL